jgi:hypothetical protein
MVRVFNGAPAIPDEECPLIREFAVSNLHRFNDAALLIELGTNSD